MPISSATITRVVHSRWTRPDLCVMIRSIEFPRCPVKTARVKWAIKCFRCPNSAIMVLSHRFRPWASHFYDKLKLMILSSIENLAKMWGNCFFGFPQHINKYCMIDGMKSESQSNLRKIILSLSDKLWNLNPIYDYVITTPTVTCMYYIYVQEFII